MKLLYKGAAFGVAAALSISLAACQSQPGAASAPTESVVQTVPTTELATTAPSTQSWDDVVELVNAAGDSTTVYLLADGRYLDRADRFFTYDGAETWTCADGTIWNRRAESNPIVHAEFAIERLLAQRPDRIFFTEAEGSETASKIVFTFDNAVVDFKFLALEGTVDDTGKFICSGTQELYTCDLITTNDLMVVETQLEGLIPTRGICFTDADTGVTASYYLTVSGEDNVPLLVQFG